MSNLRLGTAVGGGIADGELNIDGAGTVFTLGSATSEQAIANIGNDPVDFNDDTRAAGSPQRARGVVTVSNGATLEIRSINHPYIVLGGASPYFGVNPGSIITEGEVFGELNVLSGASFLTNGIVTIGELGAVGEMNVSDGGLFEIDASNTLEAANQSADINIGTFGGTGSVTISSGGVVSVVDTDSDSQGQITVGEGRAEGEPSVGSLQISGQNSALSLSAATSTLFVAAAGATDTSSGTVEVLDGASLDVSAFSGAGDVLIGGAGTGVVRVSGADSILNVTGQSGASITLAGGGSSLEVFDSALVDISSSGGSASLFVAGGGNAGSFVRGDGLIRVSNVVEVNAGGVISPGNGPNALGTLTIDGDLIVQPGGILEIDALEDGTSDSLSITGTATLNGGIVSALTPDSDFSVARDYTILAATGGVDGVFDDVTSNLTYLLPSLSYTDNSVVLTLERLGGEIQQDVLEETTSQELSINTRTTTTVVSNQVANVLSYSLGFGIGAGSGSGSGSSSTSTAYVPGSFSTGLSAGDDDMSGNVWVNYTPPSTRPIRYWPGSDREQTVDGRGYSLMVGTDRAFSERLVAGAIFGAEGTDLDFGTINGSQDNDGLMVGAYAGFLLNDYAYAGINANYTWLDNEIEEAAFGSTNLVRGEFSSERYQLAADLNFVKVIDDYDLRWQAGVSFMEETADAYQTTVGDTAQPIDQRLARLRLGFTARYSGEKHRPYLSVAYENDFDSAVELTDDSGFVTYLGIRSQGYNERLFFDAFVSAIVGREGQDHNMVGLNITYLL